MDARIKSGHDSGLWSTQGAMNRTDACRPPRISVETIEPNRYAENNTTPNSSGRPHPDARATYARKGYIAQPLTSSRTPSTLSSTVWVTAPSLKSLRKM